MTKKRTRRVLVTSKPKPFNKSDCDCDFCFDMERSNREWDSFEVKTNLQRRMKEVVERIEQEYT